MIIIKSPREVELIHEAGLIANEVFKGLETFIKPGISTYDISKFCEEIIRSHDAYPTCLNYEGFPGAVCVSVNDTLIHGIPSRKEILKSGDVVSVDLGVTKKGYIADAARTYLVGEVKEEIKRLVEVTKQAFFEGLAKVKPGNHVGDISHAIESYYKKFGYSSPKDFTGHGVGLSFHEDPYIPNQGVAGTGIKLREGMTLAIEPMICLGSSEYKVLGDGWTIKMRDKLATAHYENTVVVTADGVRILTMEDEHGQE